MKYSNFKQTGWLLLMMTLLILSGCIEFRQIALYDGEVKEEIPARPKSIDQVVSPILFEDDTLDIWGIMEDSCKNFSLTSDVTYAGNAALKLSWEREGCIWVGFGMGWDGYAGKDLTPLIDHAAFEMHVRTHEGKMYGLPLVFTLEDYSKVMSFCYTGNKYFERPSIDEEWQKVLVPLSAFDDEGEGIDYSNIKQLQIEMQQSGAVYIDEIKLVFYKEEPQEPWLVEETLPDPTILPQLLFDEGFVNGNGWGISNDDCQNISISEQESYAGDQALSLDWNASEGCELVSFGVNWYKWKHIDISNMKNEAVLNYFIKPADMANIDFKMILQGFDGSGAIIVDWDEKYASKSENGWYSVSVPMSDFEGNVDETRIQHLKFEFAGKGKMLLDKMSWVAK